MENNKTGNEENNTPDNVETTDSWGWGKIIKHVILPKPKDAPKAGKKEFQARVGMATIFGLVAFVAFSDGGVPACGDDETTTLVRQIADGEMIKQLGAEAAQQFTYSVGGIRTTDTNEKTGAFECAAQLDIIAIKGAKGNEIPITYTVEQTDNGEEFYVNVFGL